jgi:hypothetical protein
MRGYRLALAMMIAAIPVVAAAQAIPPSDMPGRERERFVDPPAPRAQSGGSIFSPAPAPQRPHKEKSKKRHSSGRT